MDVVSLYIRAFHKKTFWKLLLCSVDYVLGQIETDGRKCVCPNMSASLRKWPPHPWFNVHVTLVWQKRRGSELKNLRANPVPIALALLLFRTLQCNEHFGRHVQLIDLIKNSNTWLTPFIMLTNSVPFVINWFASFTLPLASSITVSAVNQLIPVAFSLATCADFLGFPCATLKGKMSEPYCWLWNRL